MTFIVFQVGQWKPGNSQDAQGEHKRPLITRESIQQPSCFEGWARPAFPPCSPKLFMCLLQRMRMSRNIPILIFTLDTLVFSLFPSSHFFLRWTVSLTDWNAVMFIFPLQQSILFTECIFTSLIYWCLITVFKGISTWITHKSNSSYMVQNFYKSTTQTLKRSFVFWFLKSSVLNPAFLVLLL